MSDPAPKPVVTLLTDFGLRDSYVAEMKAVILTHAPHVTVVDLTHGVPPGDIAAARYLLHRSWGRFPSGTVHVVVVDPGVGSPRRALAVSAGGHSFVGPDNGVLESVLDDAVVVSLPVGSEAAPTFHGRDVFAPAAARLALGTPIGQLGTTVSDPVRLPFPVPERRGETVVGQVVYVDRFGTLVTNIPGVGLAPGATVVVGGEHAAMVQRTFADVEPGILVAFVGSGGTLEIAVRDRSAAQSTGTGVGGEVRVRPVR